MRRYKIYSILLMCILLVMSSCSENTPRSSSVDTADTYEDLLVDFEENAEEPIEDSTAAAEPDIKDTMTEEEYLDYLAGEIPYIGMEEKYIDKTICGKHTEEITYEGKPGYVWRFDDLTALTVYVDDGCISEVYQVYEELFWDGDRPHIESVDGRKVWRPIPGALHKRWEEHESWRDKDVDNFRTAEEYADYYHDDYAELLWNEYGEEFGYDEHAIDEESYLDAIDHWECNQPWPEPEK